MGPSRLPGLPSAAEPLQGPCRRRPHPTGIQTVTMVLVMLQLPHHPWDALGITARFVCGPETPSNPSAVPRLLGAQQIPSTKSFAQAPPTQRFTQKLG